MHYPTSWTHKISQIQHDEGIQAKNDVSPNREYEERAKEYVVDRIIRHNETPDGPKYAITWYGYNKKDDTTEPNNNIP